MIYIHIFWCSEGTLSICESEKFADGVEATRDTYTSHTFADSSEDAGWFAGLARAMNRRNTVSTSQTLFLSDFEMHETRKSLSESNRRGSMSGEHSHRNRYHLKA